MIIRSNYSSIDRYYPRQLTRVITDLTSDLTKRTLGANAEPDLAPGRCGDVLISIVYVGYVHTWNTRRRAKARTVLSWFCLTLSFRFLYPGYLLNLFMMALLPFMLFAFLCCLLEESLQVGAIHRHTLDAS